MYAPDKKPGTPGGRWNCQPTARKGIFIMSKIKPYLIIAVICLITIAVAKLVKPSLPAVVQGYLPS